MEENRLGTQRVVEGADREVQRALVSPSSTGGRSDPGTHSELLPDENRAGGKGGAGEAYGAGAMSDGHPSDACT